jgi:BlaI family transcriptional regulator, penicillinase repressor
MSAKLTESELEVMQVLWEKGPLTVRQVNDGINRIRRSGYTTTLKIMQIMTEKGLLSRDTGSRSHIYSPSLRPQEVETFAVDHLLKTVFRGDRSNLILRALGQNRLSNEELREIRELIRKFEDR